MIQNTNNNETTRPLNELIGRGDTTSDLQIKAFVCNNLGSTTLLSKIPMYDFYRMSDVANDRGENGEPVAQRKLDPNHALKLAQYTLAGLIDTTIHLDKSDNAATMSARLNLREIMGKQPYYSLQPVVANLRTAGVNGSSLRAQQIETADKEGIGVKIWLGQKDILWIVDGQHRRRGLQMVVEFLEQVRMDQKYPPKKQSLFPHNRDERTVPPEELAVWIECYELTRGLCTVGVDIHLGLDIIQERQLFYDLNNKSKKIETSLGLEFDSSNPVNAFIKETLIDNGFIRIMPGDQTDWDNDDGSMTRKDLIAVNAHLILNKSNINGATSLIAPRLDVAKRFWEAIIQIPDFGEKNARSKTIAAQSVVLKAIAKLTYDFSFGRYANNERLCKLLDSITDIDFSHDNPIWRFYQLNSDEINQYSLEGLVDYLPDNSTGNRDIGNYDEKTGWMRFGSKHNDIFPIIGDMIRWKLELPKRLIVTKKQAL